MALALIGTVDLSAVTDTLLTLLNTSIASWEGWPGTPPSPDFTITVSGSMPESVRNDGGCQLNLYLLHVKENPYLKNAPVPAPHLTLPEQPLALDLSYLLTAYAGPNYGQEQKAMSIALRCLHENAIVRTTIPIAGQPATQECTIELQPQSPDELSRLWQSFGTSMRLSTLYRASVALVTPPTLGTRPAPPVERIIVSASPTTLPFAAQGQVIGTSRPVSHFAPDSTLVRPRQMQYDQSPVTVGPGESFLLLGAGLDQPDTRRVYLVSGTGTETEITSWRAANPSRATASRSELAVPLTAFPAAGVYQVRVGSDVASGDTRTYRSNGTPISITASVGPAANPPLLSPIAGLFTIDGRGFVVGTTEVLLGTVSLASTAGAPAAGEFTMPQPESIQFRPPADLPAGRYDVRVRVNGIEATPAYWVQIT